MAVVMMLSELLSLSWRKAWLNNVDDVPATKPKLLNPLTQSPSATGLPFSKAEPRYSTLVNPPWVLVSLPHHQLPNSANVNSQTVELSAMTTSPGSRSRATMTG